MLRCTARIIAGRLRASFVARAARRRPRTTSSSFENGADRVVSDEEPAVEQPKVFASLGARLAANLIDLVVITIPSLIITRLLENAPGRAGDAVVTALVSLDRKSTRLNSSHLGISYAVF